jgi:hypothetical protein
VDAAAMSDILLDEQAARAYTDARSSAGGRASSLKQGRAWLEANGYTEQDYTDDDARAAWGHSSGKATIASHGQQMGNGGRATIASHGQQIGNGGRATIASHGQQLGNCGRKSSRFFPDDFCPVLSSHPCLPLLRSRKDRNGIWLPGSNVPRVQGIPRGACARRQPGRKADEPNHDEEVDAQANMLPEHGASQASQHHEVALQGQQDHHQQEHIRSQGHLKVTMADANSARAGARRTRDQSAPSWRGQASSVTTADQLFRRTARVQQVRLTRVCERVLKNAFLDLHLRQTWILNKFRI